MFQASGKSLFRLTGDVYRGMTTHIWSVLVLSDSTVVSGDNRGQVQIWDGVTGVLMTSIQQHSADVLCIESDSNENNIFASGVDSKVVCVRRLRSLGPSSGPGGHEWVYTSALRPHSHDVYSLAICKQQTGAGIFSEVLLSGGVDTKLCIYDTVEFMKTRPRWVLPIPAKGLLSASADHQWMAIRNSNSVDIWRLQLSRFSKDEAGGGGGDSSYECRLDAKGKDHVNLIRVSPDGALLFMSSASGARMWALDFGSANGISRLQLTALTLPAEVEANMCQCASFSADSRSLAVVFSSGTATHLALIAISRGSVASPAKQPPSKKQGKRQRVEPAADAAPINASAAPSVTLRHVFPHWKHVAESVAGAGAASTGKLSADLGVLCNECTFSVDGQWIAVSSGANRVYVYEVDRCGIIRNDSTFSPK
jgi:WD40 repeat protein